MELPNGQRGLNAVAPRKRRHEHRNSTGSQQCRTSVLRGQSGMRLASFEVEVDFTCREDIVYAFTDVPHLEPITRSVVQGQEDVGPVEPSRFDEGIRASCALLGGLEEETDPAPSWAAQSRRCTRHEQARGGV